MCLWCCYLTIWHNYLFGLQVSRDVKPAVVVVQCAGYAWTGDLPFADNYPFGLHRGSSELSWRASTDGYLKSINCRGLWGFSPCDHCAALEEDDVLNRIISRAGEEDLHLSPINNQYLTATQAQRRYAAYLARQGTLRLALLASNRRLATVNSQLELSKRIFVLLSQNQIPRLHQLLAHQLKRGATPAQIAKQIELAIKGGYVASGNKTEDELDQVCDCISCVQPNHKARLVRVLCPRLLTMLNKTMGFASKSSVRKDHTDPKQHFVTCAKGIDAATIQHNMKVQVLDQDPGEKCTWTVLIDGVACEKNFRPSLNDGMLRGLCSCASGDYLDRAPKTLRDVELVQKAIDDGDVHLVGEILVVALSPNRHDDHVPRLVAAVGVCGREGTAFNKNLVKTVIKAYRSNPKGEQANGPIADSMCDGAAVLAQAKQQLFDLPFVSSVDADKEEEQMIEPFRQMPLFPQYCGRGNEHLIVDGRDSKHVAKRIRTRANTKTVGFTIVIFKFLRGTLRKLLSDAQLATEAQLREWFNEGGADAQNVPAMERLLEAFAKLGTKTAADFSEREGPVTHTLLREIKIFATYCELFLSSLRGRGLDGKALGLGAHLENLSTLSHLALVIYRKQATKFIPAQNYQNTQRWIRAAFWSVRRAQVAGVEEYYLFLDGTDPLEQTFGVIRELHGSGTMFDVVQFEDRATAAMEVQAIYARHPTWRQRSKRLEGYDHNTPASWTSTK